MRLIYAVQFQVQTEAPKSAFSELKTAASEWIEGWYLNWKHTEVPFPEVGTTRPLAGHTIVVEEKEADEGKGRLLEIDWSYPAEPDTSLLWTSHVTVGEWEGQSEFAFTLRIGSTDFRIAPPEFELKRPYLVKRVADSLRCSLGGRPVVASARHIAAEDVEQLAEYLRSPTRRLPVVVVSREPYTDRFLASPSRLADALVGLAEVVMLDDKWAGFRFTSKVGKEHSCFNGAVRLYWPSADGNGGIQSGRVYLPGEVKIAGDTLAQTLVRKLAPVAAYRFVEMPTITRVRQAILADDARSAQLLKAQVTSGTAEQAKLEAEVLKLIEQVEAARAQHQSASKERDDALIRALELEEENQTLRDNLRAISSVTPATPAVEVQGPTQSEPDSVLDALERASKEFNDRLVILKTARASAEACDFGRPSEAFEALWAIREVAEAYFTAKASGKSIGPLEAHFQQKGFKYAPSDSQTTMSNFGKQREFTNDGDKRRMTKHLTLGGGDKKNCMQIYFDIDDAKERFLVGHCGRHLDTAKYQG